MVALALTLTLSFGFLNFVIVIGIFVAAALRPVFGQDAGIHRTWDPAGWHTIGGLVVSIFTIRMAIIFPGPLRWFHHLSLHFLNPAIRLYSRCFTLLQLGC